MTDKEKPLAHERLHNFCMFDEIRIRVVPRFKTSDMSGDEWRQHAQIEFMFKGVVVSEAGYSRIEQAVMGLGHQMLTAQDNGMSSEMMALDDKLCDQPSCKNEAVARFVIKRHTARDGSWLDPGERDAYRWFRKFCKVHVHRGDCSREDCDDNYEPTDGVTASDSTNTQESPAVLVGVIDAT